MFAYRYRQQKGKDGGFSPPSRTPKLFFLEYRAENCEKDRYIFATLIEHSNALQRTRAVKKRVPKITVYFAALYKCYILENFLTCTTLKLFKTWLKLYLRFYVAQSLPCSI